MYQFVGQERINSALHQKGYPSVRITRQFMGFTEEQNKHTNPIRFVDANSKLIYQQPPAYNTVAFDFSKEILLGKAYLDSTHQMPKHIRVFNKVGWAYGFLRDVSYVVDFKHNIEYMLAATIYVNSDEILNDSKYDYDEIGQPFMKQLGETVYQFEKNRKRNYTPKLNAFKIHYDQRNKKDQRKPISVVDN